jgi:hypothetical protein
VGGRRPKKMPTFASHYSELKAALVAGRPYLAAAVAVSLLLVLLAVVAPHATRFGPFAEGLSNRRLELALVGAALPLSTLLAFLLVYWAL